jgi:hypothetical protein
MLAHAIPAAPLLPALTALLICLVGLGILLLADQIVKALFGIAESAIAWVPWIGKRAAGGVVKMEQRLNNYLQAAITAQEEAVSWTWHQLARVAVWAAHEMVELARTLDDVAWYVIRKHPVAVIAAQAYKALRRVQVVDRVMDRLEDRLMTFLHSVAKPWGGPIAASVRVVSRPWRAELDRLKDWTFPRVKALQHAIAVDIPHGIAGLRARDLSLSRAYERLRQLVKRHERALGASAVAAAVAYALARLGGTWIRCTNARRLGRRACGLDPDLLEGMLAGTLLLVGGISIVELARELQAVVGPGAQGIRNIIHEA